MDLKATERFTLLKGLELTGCEWTGAESKGLVRLFKCSGKEWDYMGPHLIGTKLTRWERNGFTFLIETEWRGVDTSGS